MMDAEYVRSVEEGNGICELCGTRGLHADCARKLVIHRQQAAARSERYVRQYAVHGVCGAVGHESQQSFEQVSFALEKRLQRKLTSDPALAIEGDNWWYIPEGSIGVIGFIVEKRDLGIFLLGSALVARSELIDTSSAWCGILAYLRAEAERI